MVSDIHYLAESLHDNGTRYARLLSEGDNKNIALVGPLLDALAWTALTSDEQVDRPDCLIVTGDLSLNGEEESHRELAERFKSLAAAGIPVYVLPGNHDIDNPLARSYQGERAKETDTVDPNGFARIYGPYGFDAALSRDSGSLSYLVQPRPGIRLLMLDSTCSGENMSCGYAEPGGRLTDSTRAWISSCVLQAKADGASLLVAMHHSLLDHNSVINLDYTIDDSEALTSFFSDLGVRCLFTGHTHIQDIAKAETSKESIYDITTNALSVYPHNYGCLRLPLGMQQSAAEYHSRSVDVEAWARAAGVTDSRLLDFNRYAEQFSREHSSRMIASILASERVGSAGKPVNFTLSEDQSGQLLELLVELNTRFFAGKDDRNKEDLLTPENLKLLERLPQGFLADYARSILSDQPPGDNALSLP